MNFRFDFKPLSQQPDSVSNNASFMQQNDQGFMGQQSIMSSQFEDNTVDSLVVVKTKKLRRARKKKEIKSYKYLDSYLIVKKDSFYFLENIENKSISFLDFNNYILENDTTQIVYQIPKKNNTDSNYVSQFIDTSSVNIISNHSVFADSISEKVSSKSIVTDTLKKQNNTQERGFKPSPKLYNEEIIKEPIFNANKSFKSLNGEFWLMAVLLSVLLIFAFVKKQYNSKLSAYFQSLISYHTFNKMYKEQNSFNQKLAFFLTILFDVNLSLLIFYSLYYWGIIDSGSLNYFIILAYVILSYALFFMFNKLIAFVFESYDLINNNLYNFNLTHRVLALFLLPMVLIIPYVPHLLSEILLFLAWGITLLSFIHRWGRSIKISFKFRVSYFYMILYLCALEIIPLMFIFKMILDKTN